MILKGEPLSARITNLGAAAANSAAAPYASGKIASGKDFLNIVGTQDEFFSRYKSFQDDYIEALRTSLDPSRAAGVDLDFLRAGGKIDLGVLKKEARKEFERKFRDDVLQLPNLFRRFGLPNVELPSANLYRRAFRYEVDTSRVGGAMHPMQVLLNRMMFNVDPMASGIDAFNVGSGNLMGLAQLRQVASTDLGSLFGQGKTIRTVDVETTSVMRGSQIRQMSIVDMHNGAISASDQYTMNFASPQLSGLTITARNGSSRTVNQFLMDGSKAVNVTDQAQFLDESTRYLNHLLDADVVAGHNVFFDLGQIAGTMRQIPGFADHTDAQNALRRLYDSMSQEGKIVDTLEYTRTYLNNQINNILEIMPNASETKRLENFRSLIYSNEFLARIRAGGSAPYASMEAISLNTNLLDLLYDDAQGGDKFAQNLFADIFKGTHVADTDSKLQSYMAKVMMTEDPNDPSRGNLLRVTKDGIGRAKEVEAAQIAIARSSALTLTTNITDVDNISQPIFDYILNTEEGRRGVVLNLEEGAIRPSSKAGILNYVSDYIDPDVENAKPYTGYMLSTAEGREQVVGKKATKIIKQTLLGAGTEEYDLGFGEPITALNKMGRRISSLPVNLLQAHNVNEIIEIQKQLAQNITPGTISKEALLDSLGTTYRRFGSTMGFADMMDVARGRMPQNSSFAIGLSNYGLPTNSGPMEIMNAASRFALASNSIKNPYANLGVRSAVYSTIMSESTSNNATLARNNLVSLIGQTTDETIKAKYQSQLETLKYVDHEDILSEYGVSHFKAQKEFRLFQSSSNETVQMSNRIFAPAEVINKVASDVLGSEDAFRRGNLTMSVASMKNGSDRLNLFWNLGSDVSKDNKRKMMEGIYDHIMDTVSSMSSTDKKIEANISIVKAHDDLLALSDRKEKAIDSMLDSFERGGIGYAFEEGESATRLVQSLRKAGVDLSNDVLAGVQTRAIDMVGDVVRTGALVDAQTVQIAGVQGLQQADDAAIAAKNEAAKVIADEGLAPRIRTNISRAKLGSSPNKVLDFYINNKANIRNVGLGLLAAGAGYYIYKNYQENKVYDETVEQQPLQKSSAGRPSPVLTQEDLASFRRDPLVTAGVVGNLDRNKIGHTKMGPNKYNHLYGN
jgi:hypothetical protein